MLVHQVPDLRHAVRERPPPAGAVRSRAVRVPVAWLRSYCDPGIPAARSPTRSRCPATSSSACTASGWAIPSGFVVGRVLEAERHPNADRLSVCVVDDGSGEPRTIVCGAPNVAAGQTVAVALPGATMPDGSELGEAKLRGVALQRNDPRRGRGGHRQRPRRHHGAPRGPGARRRAGRPPADRRRGDRAGGHAQPAGRDERLRRGARPPRRHRRPAGGGSDRRGRGARRIRLRGRPRLASRSTPRSACASPRGCSRTWRSGPHRSG